MALCRPNCAISVFKSLIVHLNKWRADWRCRSLTSIFFGLGQYAWPSRSWGLSIGWSCHSIAVLVSLFRACPRPCSPVDLFAGSHVSWHAQNWQLSLLYRFNQRPFGICDTIHCLVCDASCPAYSQHAPQGPHFECFQALLWHFADGPRLDSIHQCWPDIAFDES